MGWIDVVLLGGIAALVALMVYWMRHRKRGCGGGCSGCAHSGSCGGCARDTQRHEGK